MLETLLGGRYQVITVLGAGGFGKTFLVKDTQQPDALPCVVKQFKPVTSDEKILKVARRLFDTEAAMLAKLSQHDQIPTFVEFFEENQEFYLVQEWIDGRSLQDELAHARQLPEAEVVALLQDVLTILNFVHSHHIIHRDIKPANLIRRHQDGRLVLIDFGAVKEIHTHITAGAEHTTLTVGIGTNGYTPSEQLAGKPRFCSDLYALGMTAIQALTGLQPTQLPTDADTGDILWYDYAPQVSPTLKGVLDRMVRYHFNHRYQSAHEAAQALQQGLESSAGLDLTGLDVTDLDVTDLAVADLAVTDLPSALLPPSQLADRHTLTRLTTLPPERWRDRLKTGVKAVAIAAAAVTGITFGLRQLGWVEPLELAAYDQMVRLAPSSEADPRLLVVGITEADLQHLARATPSDRDLARAIQQLQQHQPQVIGIDLLRELPQEPGHADLLQEFQADNVIAIMKLGNTATTQLPPPAGVPPSRVGFNDLPVDPDGVIRRNLMFASVETEAFYSFSLRTALHYLADQGIQPQNSAQHPDYVQIGGTVFPYLKPQSGGYQQADAAGYQILLNYRSPNRIAHQLSLTEVLNGTFDPALVTGKIVLVGTVAPSSKDLFYTPYSAALQTEHLMPGVMLHAQMVSQILNAVLDDVPPFWFWAEWAEMVWVGAWAIAGGTVAWWVRHPLGLGGSSVILLVSIGGIGFLLFLNQGWVPLAAPAIAAILTGAAIVTHRDYTHRDYTHRDYQSQHRPGLDKR